MTETPLSEAIVTLLVAVPKFGVLAVIVTDPGATPVTGTLAAPEPATNVTDAGTVATAGLLEVRLAVKPPADAEERFSVRLCVVPGFIVKPVMGEKKLLPPPGVT